MRVLFMRNAFLFSLLLGAGVLLTGCSTADKRLDSLERQMQNTKILDIRLSNAEERLSKVEGDILALKTPPAAKGRSGKQSSSLPGSRAAAAPPQPRTLSLPAPRVASPLGVPQPYDPRSGGRKVEPRTTTAAAPTLTTRPTPTAAGKQASAGSGRSDRSGAPIALAGPPVPRTPPSVMTLGTSARADDPVPAPALSPRPASPSVKSSVPSAPKTGKTAYDAALALYYKGQYASAQDAFRDFLRQSPTSSLAPNAMYWQGECLYSQGRFDAAIMLFKDLAGKYPKHPKTAAALLKAGYAYAQLKDMENARFYWQILIDDFPASAPAGMARKRIAQG